MRGNFFPADFWILNFLGRGEPLCRHTIYCCIVSGSLWYNQVSHMVTNRNKKSFRSPRNNSKLCSDDWKRWRFWSAFRRFGTYFAESFRMSKSSSMMDPTRSCEVPSYSAIDLAQIRRSSKVSSSISTITTGVVSFLCHPGRGAKQVEKSSRLNLATQIVKVAYDSAYSSHASIRMAWISVSALPCRKTKIHDSSHLNDF